MMSGFSDDVISILRHNLMLNKESVGWLVHGLGSQNTRELGQKISSMGFLITPKKTKPVINYDYIVISNLHLTANALLDAFSRLSINGIMIVEVTDNWQKFDEKYVSLFANFVATKVQYDNRTYMVIHSGADYGN